MANTKTTETLTETATTIATTIECNGCGHEQANDGWGQLMECKECSREFMGLRDGE